MEVHAGDAVKQLPITALDGDFAYEFTVTDKEVQVQVIEILVDGKPISISPIRVVVEDFDCEVTNPGEHRESNNVGECGKLENIEVSRIRPFLRSLKLTISFSTTFNSMCRAHLPTRQYLP